MDVLIARFPHPFSQDLSCPYDATPVLRATTESGDLIDDPSEDALFMLFEDLERGAGRFLIFESLEHTDWQTYVQLFAEKMAARWSNTVPTAPRRTSGTRSWISDGPPAGDRVGIRRSRGGLASWTPVGI